MQLMTHIRQYWLPLLIMSISLTSAALYGHTRLTGTALLPSWLIFLLGIMLTGLFIFAMTAMRLARQQTVILNRINQNLKHEIQQHMKTEESKQKLEKALLKGKKLQAVGTLAGGIAHDFNNILYAIKGYTEIIREETPVLSVAYKNLGKVLHAAHRGEELIARILAFSRSHHPEMKPIELNSTLEAAFEFLRPAIPASIILHFELKDRCIVMGNQTQIHQVIVNIINNSVDAMQGEGYIFIKMAHVSAQDPLLFQFPQIPAQNYCKIDITDTGPGMDQQTLERIFEPFFTTKEVGKGTGLGLSIVHTIMKDHNGEVHVTSCIGEGTTVTLLLPEYCEGEQSA